MTGSLEGIQPLLKSAQETLAPICEKTVAFVKTNPQISFLFATSIVSIFKYIYSNNYYYWNPGNMLAGGLVNGLTCYAIYYVARKMLGKNSISDATQKTLCVLAGTINLIALVYLCPWHCVDFVMPVVGMLVGALISDACDPDTTSPAKTTIPS